MGPTSGPAACPANISGGDIMKITYYGHSCFLFDDGFFRVLTDPYLSGNPLSDVRADEVSTDFILVSHAHGDHLGDTVDIAGYTGATVISTVELCGQILNPQGIKNMAGNIGGSLKTPFGSIKYVNAVHGSGVPGGLACGFVVEMGGKKIYFAGDTALSADMALLKDEGIDVALLPIGDYYTMGPSDAKRAAQMISPAVTIPMHYNTFPAIKQDPEKFADSLREAGLSCIILSPGETFDYD